MTLTICILLSVSTLIFVLSPLWLGRGGLLAPSSSIFDLEEAKKYKMTILKKYICDKARFAEGELTKFEWKKRQDFLESRYLDVSRRQDFLEQQLKVIP